MVRTTKVTGGYTRTYNVEGPTLWQMMIQSGFVGKVLDLGDTWINQEIGEIYFITSQ